MFKWAKWIWYSDKSEENSFGEFYGTFAKSAHPVCKISCDGDYTLYVNGKYVSSNQYGDFEHYKSVDTIDLAPYISEEENKLAIVVWHFGKNTQRYKKYNAGLICEITDGDTSLFYTSEETLCRQSPTYVTGFKREISSQLGFSVAYNGTKEDSWRTGDGRNMKKAYPVDKKCTFVPRPSKKLSLGEPVFAKEISPGLYDLGREYVGLLTVTLDCKNDTDVNIAYGETLKNGQVKRIIHNRSFSLDYVARKGESAYTEYMLRLACRYLQVSAPDSFTVKRIGIIPQYYEVKEKECALTGTDKDIYDICVNTLKLCMMEHYVDCPWREQCLYAFDSRNQMLSGYYAFEGGNFDYAKSNLLLMSKDKRRDKLLSICYPCGVDLTIPSFSLYYLLSVLEYIIHSGDTEIIKDVDTKLNEILSVFLNNRQGSLVCRLGGENHWNFYDWSPYADGSLGHDEGAKPDATINILTLYGLKCYKKICELCTLPFTYSQSITELECSIRESFFDRKSGLYLTEERGVATELVNSLAIVAGLTTQREAQRICAKLVNKELIPCSLSMKCFLYDALILTDKDRYKDFILDSIRQDYTPMIETGTVWETKDGEDAFDGAGSLCHGWSATPVYYLSILKN